ncbi:stalk domain-containing protein [Paenibacillus sp. GXUN7292]|uniref:stalk domain-containing protein n=1 Tax=Paenibacillus sp. GXUN7292 TaxID=3422499 RepID=UPI003D7C5B89
MKFSYKVVSFIVVILLAFATTASAHSGRTDANGGHNCSEKSKAKGLCTGYHYHNSGKDSDSSKSSNSKSSSSSSSSKSSNSKSTTSSKSSSASYTKSSVKLFVNSKEVKLKDAPVIKNNSNYFSIQEVAKAVGATVTTDSKKSTITIEKGKKKIVFNEKNDKVLNVNGKKYAPIRSIVEGLGAKVTFDQDKNAVHVTLK